MNKINDVIIRALSYIDLGKDFDEESLLINEIMEGDNDFATSSVSLVLSSLRNTAQIGEYSFSIKGNKLKITYSLSYPLQYTILTLDISDLTKDLYKTRYIIES